jgi:hypothetical protein
MLSAILVGLVIIGVAWPYLERRGLIPAPVNRVVTDGLERLHLRPARQASGDGLVATTREQLCPQCTSLNTAGRTRCFECNAPLSVLGINEVMQTAGKEELVGEAVQAGLLLVIMFVAMALANNLPLWGKGLVITATIGVLAFRFLKNNGT